MSRRPRARLAGAASAFVLGAFTLGPLATPALAHDLDLSTARVTLRDGHVEVVAEIDVVQAVLRSGPQGLDATALATATEAELADYVSRTQAALETGARLEADGAQAPLVLRAFPSPPEVRALAARRSVASAGAANEHGQTSTLRFEGRRPIAEARTVSVTLPKCVGPVLYSFVQPTTRLGAAGGVASFDVLSAPREAPARGRSSGRPWLAFAAGIAAIVAVLAQIVPRRGPSPLSRSSAARHRGDSA